MHNEADSDLNTLLWKRRKSSDNGYDRFASVYNQYFGKEAYRRLGPVLIPILKASVPAPACILDLCCGCGHFSAGLAEIGYRVVGVDISNEMLRFARMNAPSASFLNQDARNVNITNDATICTFNSIANFKSHELAGVFSKIAKNLPTAGLFIFDTYTKEAYANRWNGQYSVEIDDAVVTVRPHYRSKNSFAKNLITIHHQGGLVRLRLTMHAHSTDLLSSELRKAGFQCLEVGDVQKDFGVTNENDHLIFVASKAGRHGSDSKRGSAYK
jgi:SAM-dependent methyltransferase